MRPRNEIVALTESQPQIIDSTNSCCALDDGFEDRLHVRGRAADNAEHFSSRRLMLQGLAQFRVAFLDLFEQSDILDSDDGLRKRTFQEA